MCKADSVSSYLIITWQEVQALLPFNWARYSRCRGQIVYFERWNERESVCFRTSAAVPCVEKHLLILDGRRSPVDRMRISLVSY